jgi:hypothetical protein
MKAVPLAALPGAISVVLATCACRTGVEHDQVIRSAPVAKSAPSSSPAVSTSARAAKPSAAVHAAAQGSTEESFSSPYGSSLRNSKVLVPRRRFEDWARHAITMRKPFVQPYERVPPFALVVSPDGHHGVLMSRQHGDVLSDEGVAWPTNPEDITAFDDLLFIAGGRTTRPRRTRSSIRARWRRAPGST